MFENISDDKWIEKLGDVPAFEFKAVKVNGIDSVLLFDRKREVFVELNQQDSNYGLSADTLRPLYVGRWLNSDILDRFDEKNQDLDDNKGNIMVIN